MSPCFLARQARARAVLLALLLVAALLPGCARNVQVAPAKPAEWRCDEAADKALQDNDLDRAISLHEALLARDPGNALARYHLGYAFGLRNERQREIALYEQALADGYTKSDLYFNLGMAYAETGNPAKADATFQKALTTNPRDAEAHFGLAMLALSQSNLPGAEKELLTTVALDPAHEDARFNLAALYEKQGQKAKSLEQLTLLLQHHPDSQPGLELLQRVRKMK